MNSRDRCFAKHIILELWDAKNTNSASTIKQALHEACESGNLKLGKIFIHRFAPHGVSGMAVIDESHIAIHTWPEYGFAAVDIYSSSDTADISRIASVIKGVFAPCQVNQIELDRGTKRP